LCNAYIGVQPFGATLRELKAKEAAPAMAQDKETKILSFPNSLRTQAAISSASAIILSRVSVGAIVAGSVRRWVFPAATGPTERS